MNRKFIILLIFLVVLLSVSTVSAADNATSNIASVEKTTDEIVSVECTGRFCFKSNTGL